MRNSGCSSELSSNILCPGSWFLTVEESDLDLICRQLSQYFTFCIPVDAEIFYLQLFLSEELLDLQRKSPPLTSNAKACGSP